LESLWFSNEPHRDITSS